MQLEGQYWLQLYRIGELSEKFAQAEGEKLLGELAIIALMFPAINIMVG